MILAWPLTTSTELAQVLRPGSHLRADSALRTLRERGLAAEPISVVPRSARGASGRVVWYSVLMVDVARLLRRGDDATSTMLHRAASQILAHRSAGCLAERLVAAGPDPDPAALDAETGGALTRLAMLTESARAEHAMHLGVDTFVGRVAEVAGRVVVFGDDDSAFPLHSSTAAPSPPVGTLVSVDTEMLSNGATMVWTRPAFQTETDSNERVGGDQRLLDHDERNRLPRPVTTAR